MLDDEAAQALAQGAQRLASALEDEDGCAAMAEADAVASQARDGVAAGTVPPNVANEVEAVTSELTADIACEPDDLDDEAEDDEAEGGPPDDDPGEGPSENRGNGEGRGGGQDRGNGPDGEGPPGQAGGRGGGR